ncbi:hypothetical protein NDU88_002667 [Pleurodeles waltl]|uniref:Uncharacterized protein n=1 Tax=Pleurodeles waltl TaxID=8319 RepID=A0AAV7M4L4_PLEWA|nr:hypothetical protein NDU88_002667 [Pleurodeles waltl]
MIPRSSSRDLRGPPSGLCRDRVCRPCIPRSLCCGFPLLPCPRIRTLHDVGVRGSLSVIRPPGGIRSLSDSSRQTGAQSRASRFGPPALRGTSARHLPALPVRPRLLLIHCGSAGMSLGRSRGAGRSFSFWAGSRLFSRKSGAQPI